MKAIILAAGRGSRMQQLTNEIPKCLINFQGKPLLEHQLSALSLAKITDIAIVTGYKAEKLFSYGTKRFFNSHWSTTNMVGSLLCADEWLSEDTCIISYSDIIYSCHAVKNLMGSASDLAITYDPAWLTLWKNRFEDPLSDAETFRLSKDHMLIEIGQRPSSLSEIEGQYMGLLKITPHAWLQIKSYLKNLPAEIINKISMTELLNKLIFLNIHAVAINDSWYEFDSETDLSSSFSIKEC